MGQLEEITALESLRKQEWRKFLFKESMFLNLVIYACLIGAIYSWLHTVAPSWFIDVEGLGTSDRFSEEELLNHAAGRIQEQGGIFVMITIMFAFAMCLIKLAFYHTKFIVNFNQISYYKAYQAFNQKHFLNKYFIFSHENFPIEVIRDSEIATHDKDVVMAKEKRWEMYLSNGYFSGYINGCEALMGHVMCKDTFKNKGQTQVVVIHNALTISILLRANLVDDFRLKIEHDKTNKWFGQFFQSSKLGSDNLLKLDDKKFEKLFKIYSNNPEESESYLTEERKLQLKKWKLQLDKKMKVTLINNRFTIALPRQKMLLYPKIYKRCTLSRFEKGIVAFENIFNGLDCFNENDNREKGHAV